MTTDPIATGLQRYADFFATLAPGSLGLLDQLVTEDVHFRDPFNDVCGRAKMKAIFRRMYEDCTDIRFVVDGSLQQGSEAFLKWTFHFRPRRFSGGRIWVATGVSELHFAPDGRVAAHFDHWDAGAQFYARLPVLGPLVRLVRRHLEYSG